MKKMFLVFAVALALFMGCASQGMQKSRAQMPGSDRDSHGCIGSAGYIWCAEKSKCLRPWEENCTSAPALVGNDKDEHGCIGSAGYSWCASLGACVRPWETTCPEKSEVRVLTENFPPFNFKENNVVEGRSSKIVRLILFNMGQSADIEIINWPEAYQIALTTPNVAIYSAARSPQRESSFKWVGPIGTYDKTLYKKNGSSVKLTTLEDAKKAKSICVVQYDDRQQMLSGLGFANLMLKENDSACLEALSLGETDLWFGSTDTMPYVAAGAGVSQSAAVPALHVESSEIYIAFSKSTPDATVQKWQAALDEMKLDGLYGNTLVWWGSNITPGSDIDEHGCIGSAGYTWCAGLNSCIRPWEASCPAQTDRLSSAKKHCNDANVAQVSICGQYVKVVSSLMGGGSTFYSDDSTQIRCPLVAPDSMSEQCRMLTMGSNCVEQMVDCSLAIVPAAITDLHDDPNYVGAQLTWSKPDKNAVAYSIYRGNKELTVISLITTTSQASYNDVFDGGNQTFAYFVRAQNADGALSENSNVVLVQQLSTSTTPSPGQIN
ncbi:MAG: transporter substrate-binding domain-containing protein [Candidatus Micrarchaeota archaeon]|nr:transporter substrate-binding domain-containing protein [Candidatus Micrarchaeota archaeon]